MVAAMRQRVAPCGVLPGLGRHKGKSQVEATQGGKSLERRQGIIAHLCPLQVEVLQSGQPLELPQAGVADFGQLRRLSFAGRSSL